ncbi:MAG: cytochrome C oxidase subunit IV family protein [Candidatus Hermodarchaeota archaeon]
MNENVEEIPVEGKRPYIMVLIYLAILTVIEVVIGGFTEEMIGTLYVLVIYALLALSLVKAILVAGFFMGIKYEIGIRRLIVLGVFGLPLLLAVPVALVPIFG